MINDSTDSMVCKLNTNRQRTGISKSKYSTIYNIQKHSNIQLQSEMNTRHTEINHVRTLPSAQIEADDAKKRGRLALNS